LIVHLLDRAIDIALEAHTGQFDKTGKPYFLHCNRVAAAVGGISEKIVAYLHDVVEKGENWTFERVQSEGFPSDIIAAIDALTQLPDEPDGDFVDRAISNVLAKPVKKADLIDNLTQANAVGLDLSKYERG
jgi:(p)ppGpp synthase/HD superfamily hydrolase